MDHILIPATNVEDWKRLLADPDKQWRKGYFARTLAYCWQEADGFPPEILNILLKSDLAEFREIEILLAIPEHKVALPGGGRPSQNDLFVLAKAQDKIISITIEEKVSEPFGPTLEEWSFGASSGKEQRLAFLKDLLGLPRAISLQNRYQLFHRAASAVLEAVRFNARYAAMIIHSFSKNNLWFEDYRAFLELFGVRASLNKLNFIKEIKGINLYFGWAKGDEKYLKV